MKLLSVCLHGEDDDLVDVHVLPCEVRHIVQEFYAPFYVAKPQALHLVQIHSLWKAENI